MTKDEMREYLMASKSLNEIQNAKLLDVIVEDLLEDFDIQLTNWEQFRVIKQKADKIWRGVKRLSEREVVTRRVIEYVKATQSVISKKNKK